MRDEIIQLVRDAIALGSITTPFESAVVESAPEVTQVALKLKPPRTGVEIVSTEVRKGTKYFAVRDLRNERVVTNVTRASARKLWQYAIEEHEKNPVDSKKVQWVGDIGIWKQHKHGGKMRYDLAQRAGDKTAVYYGVTEDGVRAEWRALISGEEVETAEAPMPEVEMPETEMPLAVFEMPVTRGEPAPATETISPIEPMPIEVTGETVEPRTEIAPEEITPAVETPAVAETSSEQAASRVEEEPPAEGAPAEPVLAEPTSKTTAQLWREELERALQEARAAQERKNEDS
jgi:hypothetical protein